MDKVVNSAYIDRIISEELLAEDDDDVVNEDLKDAKPSTSSASDVPVSVVVPAASMEMKIEIVNECGECGIVATPLLTEDGKEGSKEGIEMSLSPHGRVYKHSVKEDEDTFWIACDVCKKWFHGRCARIEEFQDGLIDSFHCRFCEALHGPTAWHQAVAPHRIAYNDPSQVDLPMEVGTKAWIETFAQAEDSIPAPSDEHVTIFEDGFHFTESFNRNENWTKVFLIKDPKGLELRMPPEDFSTADLVKIFGENHQVDTIDVYRQVTHAMSLGAFHERMNSPSRDRLYNFLSLEFSKNEKMKDIVAPPILVYELSFVHQFWPDRHDPINYDSELDFLPEGACWAKEIQVAEEHKKSRPDVALFCLSGMGGSYTDFHIDFGGSSVWYHIFKGEKVFYIAAPTEKNLAVFERHQKMEKRTETFLGDMLPKGELHRVVIKQGQTLMIPSGWIHAVYTPKDSLVFGGNFLHELNIPMQLRVYDIEQAVRAEIGMDDKFMFPQFELVHWYAARSILLMKIKEDSDQGKLASDPIYEGTKAILPYLKSWIEREESAYDKSSYSSNMEVYKKLKKEFENQEHMRSDDSGGRKSAKKSKKSKKRRSIEDSDDDDYTPKKKSKKPKKSTEAPVQPKEEAVDDKNPESADYTPNESFGIRFTKKGEKYSSELVERPSAMIADVNVATMFGRTSSSGRTPKLAGWLAAAAGDEIVKESKKLEEIGEMPKKREPVVYSKAMDDLMAKEDKEDDLYTERKTKKVVAAAVTKPPPPKKKATTAKQRLASKMGLRP